jgi:hypothetical protein
MKKLFLIVFISAVSIANAQFKDQLNKPIDYKGGILNGSSSSLFGFFNPDNFSMNHTFNLSYQTFGGGSLALGVYTNNMAYKISDNLNVEADLSVVNSPYNSFGDEFAKQINGFYLSRAQINYKPSEKMSIIFQYRNVPMSYYSPYSYYGNYGWGYSPFYGY